MDGFRQILEILLAAPDRQVFLVFGVLLLFVAVAGGFPGMGQAPGQTRAFGAVAGSVLVAMAFFMQSPISGRPPVQALSAPRVSPTIAIPIIPIPTRRPPPPAPTFAPFPTPRPQPTPGFPSLNKP